MTLLKYKGYDLPRDVPLILGTLVGLLYYEMLVQRRPLPVILESIRAMGDGRSASPLSVEGEADLDKLWRACTFWMARVLRHPRPCLRRSLVLYRWCSRRGVDSKVVVGVGKDGDLLKGHAWIVIEGRAYREDPASLEREYVVMLEG